MAYDKGIIRSPISYLKGNTNITNIFMSIISKLNLINYFQRDVRLK